MKNRELADVTAEQMRINEDARRERNWSRWGPYLAERQWGTVREDYSPNGDCWSYFPHDHARSRAYRWGEDGLLGICDRQCRIAFALALWNGNDAILKERLFGLVNSEGNHGEDCKELYYYLDSTPTHSYMKALYKYPQAAFPYEQLVSENRRRGPNDGEFELVDTGVFDENRYFDVQAEYAKSAPEDILIRITVSNRGPDRARICVLPTLWFRNVWSWDEEYGGGERFPELHAAGEGAIAAHHPGIGDYVLYADAPGLGRGPKVLLTDNETNTEQVFGFRNGQSCSKDAFHEYVIAGREAAVKKSGPATKGAFLYDATIPAGDSVEFRLRLARKDAVTGEPFAHFDRMFEKRRKEANEFYRWLIPNDLPSKRKSVIRQAYAGLLWSKQFYYYVVRNWLNGDPDQPAPPTSRRGGRNNEWPHFHARDVLSMPDKWEYPWFAAWDLAFHMIPFADLDPNFTKKQLELFLREWYLHPNGQMPAYEFAFGDVNPPVHAWACWRVYKITGPRGKRDRAFLERVFHKLLLNFTWWVNRKDPHGKHLFAGGFLGLDNIGVFDRSQPLPTGGELAQADGTAWMAFYCGTMLSMALELAGEDPVYEDIASKFLEHFVTISDAMNHLGGSGLWDDQDGFYYDKIVFGDRDAPLKVRSLVGVIPLFAVEVLEQDIIDKLPGFKKRMDWFLTNREDLSKTISYMHPSGELEHGHRLLAIPRRDQLERVLRYLLDENEFLSPYGVRSVSKYHESHPYVFHDGASGRSWEVRYTPGESVTNLFGGNSNWRGPIWFPLNYLIIECLERYHHFYGDSLKVECPTGSGTYLTLDQVAAEIGRRLGSIFLPAKGNGRPVHGGDERYANDPHWKDLVLFYEYFHGDTGRGVGASHQTGWTALATRLMPMGQ